MVHGNVSVLLVWDKKTILKGLCVADVTISGKSVHSDFFILSVFIRFNVIYKAISAPLYVYTSTDQANQRFSRSWQCLANLLRMPSVIPGILLTIHTVLKVCMALKGPKKLTLENSIDSQVIKLKFIFIRPVLLMWLSGRQLA